MVELKARAISRSHLVSRLRDMEIPHPLSGTGVPRSPRQPQHAPDGTGVFFALHACGGTGLLWQRHPLLLRCNLSSCTCPSVCAPHGESLQWLAMMYHILLHWRLHQALRGDARHLVVPLAKTLGNLQFGYWAGGTRVKRLAGFAKPVYEARLDAGHRVLFTMAHSAAAEPPHALAPHLLIWDVRTHDRVAHARRWNFASEASFLDFAVQSDNETDGPIADTPDVDHATCPAAAAPADELREAVRWFALDHDSVIADEQWQHLFDAADRGLELKLTAEQYAVLHAPGPVLVSGAAGSGKSTLAIYWLVRHGVLQPDARALYLTYSDALLDQTRAWLADVLHARATQLRHAPRLLTFPALYHELCGGTTLPVRFEEFARWYCAYARRDDAALAWEEIRGIIKGACLEPARSMLDRAAYEELGRKRAPLYNAERPRLYALARNYEEWLRGMQRDDDIDLARRALAALSGNATRLFDIVVCDEAQDLTEIEMALLLRLCADQRCRHVLIAGDPQQIVNPSGFRWAELRSLLRTRLAAHGAGPPSVIRLTRNFRSVRGVVDLANAVLEVQRRRTGRSDDDVAEQGVTFGPMPVLVEATRADALAALRDFGPNVAVIAGDAATAAALRRHLNTTRIFDIPAAKGLEFDTIVLWNVCRADEPVWRRLLCGTEPLRDDPVARRALHYVYVAITRARRWLAIYEEDPAHELWLTPAVRPALECDGINALTELGAAAATPAAWREQGEYYFARRRFRQAEECYRRAGDLRAASTAEAHALELAGNPRAAADLFLKLALPDDAARAFERAGAFERAAELLEQAGRPDDAHACRVRGLTRAGRWADLGRLHQRQCAWDAAIDAFARAGQHAAVSTCRIARHTANNEWHEVARLEEERGDRAAAARAYERAGDAAAAARCRSAAAPPPAVAPPAKEMDWAQRALRHEERGDLARALGALAHLDDQRSHAKQHALRAEIADDLLTAACLEHDLAEWHAVRRIVTKHGMRRAGTGELGDAETAQMKRLETLAEAQLIWQAKSPLAALDYLMKSSEFEHEDIQRLCATIERASGQWNSIVELYQRARHVDAARRCAAAAPNAAALLAKLDALAAEHKHHWEAAAQSWAGAGDPQRANVCNALHCEQHHDYARAATYWSVAGNDKNAHACRAQHFELAGDFPNAALSYKAAGNHTAARQMLRQHERRAARAAFTAAGPTAQPDLFAFNSDGSPNPHAARDFRLESIIAFIHAHPLCTRKDISAGLAIPAARLVNDWPVVANDPCIAHVSGSPYRYASVEYCARNNIVLDERRRFFLAPATFKV